MVEPFSPSITLFPFLFFSFSSFSSLPSPLCRLLVLFVSLVRHLGILLLSPQFSDFIFRRLYLPHKLSIFRTPPSHSSFSLAIFSLSCIFFSPPILFSAFRPIFSAKSLSKTRCFLLLSSLVFFLSLSHTISLPSSRLLSHLPSFLHVFQFLSFSMISVDSPIFRRIILPLSSISSLNPSRDLNFFPNTPSHTLRHLLPLSPSKFRFLSLTAHSQYAFLSCVLSLVLPLNFLFSP